MEAQLLSRYERSVAAVVAHAALHLPNTHDESLRDLVLKGELAICDRCARLREALIDAAFAWRRATKRKAKAADESTATIPATDIELLGLAG